MAMNVPLIPSWDIRDYPLSFECINDLGLHLDSEHPTALDWRMLLAYLGFDNSSLIQVLKSKKGSHTQYVIKMYYTMDEHPTWCGIHKALKAMERADAEAVLVKHAEKLGLPSDTASTSLPAGWGEFSNMSQRLGEQNLSFPCMREITELLNPEHPVGLDWKILASKLGCKTTDMDAFARTPNPAMAFLQDYQIKEGSTLGNLFYALKLMPRYDVIYCLWKQGAFTAGETVPQSGKIYSQSLSYDGSRDTARRAKMSEQPKRQISQQDSASFRRETENLCRMFHDLGIDEKKANRAIHKAYQQNIYDPDVIYSTYLSEDDDTDTESTDSDDEPHFTSMGASSVYNYIRGGNVQIGKNNKIITVGGAAPMKQKKTKRKHGRKGEGDIAHKYDKQGRPQVTKKLVEMGFSVYSVQRVVKQHPNANIDELVGYLLVQQDNNTCSSSEPFPFSETGGYPAVSGGDPAASGGYPAASGGDPAASGGDPAASGGDPAASGGDRAASGGDPAALGGDPAASDGDPAASGGDPAASGGDPAASVGDPAASGGDRAASGGDPAALGGDPAASDGDPAASGGDPAASGGDPAASGGDPASSGGDPASSGGDPASSGGDPASSGGDPAASGQNPDAQEVGFKKQLVVDLIDDVDPINDEDKTRIDDMIDRECTIDGSSSSSVPFPFEVVQDDGRVSITGEAGAKHMLSKIAKDKATVPTQPISDLNVGLHSVSVRDDHDDSNEQIQHSGMGWDDNTHTEGPSSMLPDDKNSQIVDDLISFDDVIASDAAPSVTMSTLSQDPLSTLYDLSYQDIEDFTDNFANLISDDGAFGPVYEGVFKHNGPHHMQKVAIKKLSLNKGEHGEREYKREVSVSEVKHPNILPVYAVCKGEGEEKCIVYPSMENRDLAQQIKKHNPELTWQRRLKIAIGISRAVKCLLTPTKLRTKKIFHRDIKSANILLSRYWWPYLGDTGLTREIPKDKKYKSMTGDQRSLCGTKGYQDPDLVRKPDGYYDEACDTYSLGKVLMELLTSTLAEEFDSENGEFFHTIWEDECEDANDLCKYADKEWPASDENNKVTLEFSKLILSCLLNTRRLKRPKIADICEKLENLAAENHIQIVTPSEDNKCCMCLMHPRSFNPVGCGCQIFCADCITNYTRNELMCPTHGSTKPIIDGICFMCSSNPVSRISLLSCDCRVLCLPCIRNHNTQPCVCPTHRNVHPIIGHNTFLLSVGVGGQVYERDAEEIYNVFTNPAIGCIDKKKAWCLLGKDATVENIESTYSNIAKSLKELDEDGENVFIFYYSGHCSKEGFIKCSGGGKEIRARKLQILLEEIKATRRLLIFDCCFANTMFPHKYRYGTKDGDQDEDESEIKDSKDAEMKDVSLVSTVGGRGVMMWGSSDNRKESHGAKYEEQDGNSVFTKYILDGLKGAENCSLKLEDCQICSDYRESLKFEQCVLLSKIRDYVFKHVEKEMQGNQNPQTAGVSELDFKLAYLF